MKEKWEFLAYEQGRRNALQEVGELVIYATKLKNYTKFKELKAKIKELHSPQTTKPIKPSADARKGKKVKE